MNTRQTPPRSTPVFVPSAAKPVPANGPSRKTLALMGVGVLVLVIAGYFTLDRQRADTSPVSTLPGITIEESG